MQASTGKRAQLRLLEILSYNIQPMNEIKMRPLHVLWLFLILILFASAWQINRQRTVPLERAFNPMWWSRHLQGTDLYDPETAVLYHGSPKYQEVALTIDDGPNPKYAPQILAVLRQYRVPATFFLVGTRVSQNETLTEALAQGGDEIGNHTYDHKRLDALKPHEIANEIRLDDAHIFKATGRHTDLVRPPGVQYNDKVLHIDKTLGYVTVSWSVAAKDYLKQTPDFIATHVLDRVDNGSIILLHQDTPYTAEALPVIISKLEKRHYRFVTITQMLEHMGVHMPLNPSQ
jgi:peptidoglycan/xylan/chitin deacetylase (PgdA/CDA1 family)